MFGWKPKSGVFYRSWSGDGKHNVIVGVIIDGLRYPSAFKIHKGLDGNTYICDISILPHEYSQIGRKGRIPQNLLNWSFHFSMPLEMLKFKKKQQTKTLMPEQGYRTVPVDFKTINYDVEVKNFPEKERSRFNSWKDNFAKGKPTSYQSIVSQKPILSHTTF
jgi:hypothetical protein